MKYCNTCLYPETKPDLWFDEDGKCSACIAFEKRKEKDWNKWEGYFHQEMKRNKRHPVYDCIIPVSGGKDSHYQVLKVLELGYNPLCVNARTDDLSELGRKNLDNIGELGVDLIEVNTNRKVRRRIQKYALDTVGDISWGEHVTIFTIPFTIAVQYGIPLIIYGENPQNEYGAGPQGTEEVIELGYEWLQEFGGLNGLRVNDIVAAGIATEKEMFKYKMPDDIWIEVFSPKAIFLGQFFPWDGRQNACIAGDNGFKEAHERVSGTPCAYENLDNYQTGIHDYFKYIKFGFGRTTDIVNNWIRRGGVNREDGKHLILQYDGEYPTRYLGKSLGNILTDIWFPPPEFDKLVDKFANKELFTWKRGKLIPNFLEDLKNA